jgi:hypothetical protein
MHALRSELDWAGLLRAVTEQGAGFDGQAVGAPFLDRLAAELRDGPFAAVQPVVGQVRQEAESFELAASQLSDYPVLAGLRDELVAEVHQRGIPDWMPNEVAVQRYRPGAIGITPHRDQRRYALIVAVITVSGSAPLTLCRNRQGDALSTWHAGPGSLVLLRGPGLAGEPDGRPLHAIGGPTDQPRTSVGLRMDTGR